MANGTAVDHSSPSLSRRTALKRLTMGAGMAVLTGQMVDAHSAASQADIGTPAAATPAIVPVMDPLPVGVTVASKAAELAYDLDRIVRFVTNDIRYEPYAGALRGAEGTLWTLAGNSVDTSLLLAALLEESLITWRLATGTLNDAQVTALTDLATPTASDLAGQYVDAFAASTNPTPKGIRDSQVASPDVAASPDAEEDTAAIDAELAAGRDLITEAASLAQSQTDMIASALQEAGIVVKSDAVTVTVPPLESSRFTWVQVADGPVWIDVLPVPLPGTIVPTETFATLPDDHFHTVDIRLIAEEVRGQELERRELVRLSGPAASLVNVPVSIVVQPPGELAGLGLTLNQVFTGDISLVPYLYARDIIVVADPPIVFGSAEGGLLDSLGEDTSGPGEGETIALWLDIQQTSPGSDAIHIERALMDRLGAERRLRPIDLADPATRDAIAPVEIVPYYDTVQTIADLAPVHLLNTDLGRLPVMYAINDVSSTAAYGVATYIVPSMTAYRDALRMHVEVPLGYQSMIDRPQFTLATLSLDDPSAAADEGEARLQIDLLHRSPRASAIGGGTVTGDVHPAIMAGVLEQVCEHQQLAIVAEDTGDDVLTVSTIFDLALEQDVPVVAVADMDGLSTLDLDAVSLDMLERAIGEGMIAIVPQRAVRFGDSGRAGWWLVNPETGETRDQLDDGTGGAMLVVGKTAEIYRPPLAFSEFGEYNGTNEVPRPAANAFRRSLCGRIVNALAVASMVLVAGVAASHGDVLGATNAVGGIAKVEEERQKIKEIGDAARRNGGSGCG